MCTGILPACIFVYYVYVVPLDTVRFSRNRIVKSYELFKSFICKSSFCHVNSLCGLAGIGSSRMAGPVLACFLCPQVLSVSCPVPPSYVSTLTSLSLPFRGV